MSASPRINRMGWGALIFHTFALFSLGVPGALIVGGGCSENVFPATNRGDVCTAVGEPGDAGWWSLASAPALLFGAVGVGGGRRGPLGHLCAAECATLVAVDAILIAIVTGNL